MRNRIAAMAMSGQGNGTSSPIRQRVGVFQWLCVAINEGVSLVVSFMGK